MTDQPHIASFFDRDLDPIEVRIMKMGGMVERAIDDAACSLGIGDAERAEVTHLADAYLAHAAIECDRDVDQMYHAIIREFLTNRMKDPGDMKLRFIARNNGRMGDMVNSSPNRSSISPIGEMPRHTRPQVDWTPTEPVLSHHIQI